MTRGRKPKPSCLKVIAGTDRADRGRYHRPVCLGVELNPAYCDVAVKRWQDFTGQEATLEGDDRTFGEIEAERATTKAA